MMSNVRVSRLKNGTRVVTSTLPQVESVSVGIWVGVGGRYESGKMAGASHFLEHLMFKGTRKRSSREISQAIEGAGGYLNAFTQEESTCYYARVSYDKLWKALDVLSDMYLNSLFAPVEIEKERGVIIEEIMMYRDQPQHLVQEMLSEAVWKNHPLGVPIIGFPENIKSMKRRDIMEFRQSKCVPGNTVVAFAGKLDHETCVKRVEDCMGGLKKRAVPSFKRVTSKVGQDRVVTLSKDIEQAHLAMGIRVFGREHDKRYALRVLNAILGENMSSRLFQVVREKYGLAYSVHSSCQLYADSGGLIISAGLDKKRQMKGIELIIREVARMKERCVGPSELTRAKEYAIGQMRLGLESTSNQMMYIGDSLISHGKYICPAEAIEKIKAVTREEIRRLAEELFKKSRTTISLISPGLSRGDEALLRRMLGKL